MNDQHDTSAAANTARAFDLEALRKLDMDEIYNLRQVTRTIANIIDAFISQPRFYNSRTGNLNGAGKVLEDLADVMFQVEGAAKDAALAAAPDDHSRIEYRAWTLLGFETECCEDLAEFAALAARCASDEAKARTRAGRAA